MSSGRVPALRGMRLITAAFALRVAGQAVVARRPVRWLPPMEQWQSGVLPYPVLLIAQVVILAGQVRVIRRLRRPDKVKPEAARFARLLRRAGCVYAGAMIVRYIVSMTRFPERR